MAGGMAAMLLGIGDRGDGLQKLKISYRSRTGKPKEIEALFNPGEISTSRSVSWSPPRSWAYGKGAVGRKGDLQFVSVDAETLSITLFFDTYEKRTASSGLQRAAAFVQTASPFATSEATNVTKLTKRLSRLAEVDKELHHPPICRLSWGAFTDIFTGVLTQLDQQYTMFLPNGTPVRASLSCTFTEFRTPAKMRAGELHSADVVKTRTVVRGDTLHSIAAQEYNDPALWRHIARANGILTPRLVQPGAVLIIPKLAG